MALGWLLSSKPEGQTVYRSEDHAERFPRYSILLALTNPLDLRDLNKLIL